jgi:hypothetical protein
MTYTFKALFEFMVFDAPKHEYDTGQDGKDQGVGKMSVQRQFDEISS